MDVFGKDMSALLASVFRGVLFCFSFIPLTVWVHCEQAADPSGLEGGLGQSQKPRELSKRQPTAQATLPGRTVGSLFILIV